MHIRARNARGEIVCLHHHTCRLVEFVSKSEMLKALDKMNGKDLNGRKIELEEDLNTRERRKRCIFLCVSHLLSSQSLPLRQSVEVSGELEGRPISVAGAEEGETQ